MAMNIPWKLLKDIVSGNISENDRARFEKWRSESRLNQSLVDEILEDKSFRDNLVSGKWDNSSKEWKTLLSKIRPDKPEIRLTRKILYPAASVAAAVILLLGISLGIFLGKSGVDEIQIAEEYSYIYSPRGQRTQVILPDQTKVWLNSESSLKYSTAFNKKEREVYLVGEGYFEVKKNAGKPFYVNADEVQIRVYGTSFNVKAFPEDENIETTLIEGKLSVIPLGLKGKTDQEILMKPNEKCIYKKVAAESRSQSVYDNAQESDAVILSDSVVLPIENVNNIMLARNAYIEPEKNWKDGKLVFKDETFGNLEAELERWFNVNIHFEEESIKNFRFTGVFEKETINEAMEALRLSSQNSYDYEIQFREIYLKQY